jgi:hypothetical protein
MCTLDVFEVLFTIRWRSPAWRWRRAHGRRLRGGSPAEMCIWRAAAGAALRSSHTDSDAHLSTAPAPSTQSPNNTYSRTDETVAVAVHGPAHAGMGSAAVGVRPGGRGLVARQIELAMQSAAGPPWQGFAQAADRARDAVVRGAGWAVAYEFTMIPLVR